MKTIEVYVTTGKVGSRCVDTIELDDDCTDAEIEEYARDAMFEMIEWGYEEVP